MQVDVTVLLEKSTQAIMEWQLKTDTMGVLRVAGNSVSNQTPERKWKELTLKINQRAVRATHTPVEIFLYLPEGLLSTSYNDLILAQVITAARNHAWAAKLYVTWDQVPATSLELLDLYQFNLLTECFRTLLSQRVTDLIEITRMEKPLGQINMVERREIFRGRATSSEKRKKELTSIVRPDGWSYAVRNESWRLEELLSEFVHEGLIPSASPNHMIVFDSVPLFSVKELMDRFAGLGPKDGAVIATTLESHPAVKKHYMSCENLGSKDSGIQRHL